MVIRLCAVVLVSVQRNEAGIVRLLTVSARFSGTRNGCGVLARHGVLSWLMVHIVTSIRQGRLHHEEAGMVIRLCAVVLASVQRNEAAIVRLLTVSARFSGKGMVVVCYCVRACFPG
ncbi:hypothetical protein E0384_24270 [Escherichia coli]|nr:hypothetical protein [Escherichia coli]HAM3730264.1 hypothetical protein [Escherichia coli]